MTKRLIKIVLPTLFFLAAFFYLSGLVFDMDDGIALYNAWQFWNSNSAIYSSRFIEYIAPGTSFSVYYFWKLLGGPEYVFAHMLFLLFWTLGVGGLLLIIRKYSLKPPISLFLVFYWLIIFRFTSRINHNAFSASIALLLIYQLLTIKNSRSFLTAGLLNGIMLWYLQSTGIAFFISALAFFIATKRKPAQITIYVFGFAATILGLFSLSGIKQTITSLFFSPLLSGYINTNMLNTKSTIFAVAAFMIVGSMIFMYKVRRRQDFLLLLIIQSAMYFGSFYNFGRGHFVLASLPAVIFIGLALSDKKITNRYPFLLIAVKATAVIMGAYILTVALGNLGKPKAYEFNRYSRVWLDQTSKAKNIYAGPYLPAVYYYTRKKTSFVSSHTDITDKRTENLMLNQLKTIKPELAFLNYRLVSRLEFDKNNDLDNFIRKHFLLCSETIMGTQIYAISGKYCPN